jgi:hypothetical protein
MDDKSRIRLNKILQWALAAGGITSAATLALKAIGELGEVHRQNKIEKELEESGRPSRLVSLRSPMLANKLEDIELSKTAAESIGPVTGEALKWLAAIAAGGIGLYGSNKLFNKIKQQALKTELEDSAAQYYSTLYMRKKLDDDLAKQKMTGAGMYRFASAMDEEQTKVAGMMTSVLGGGAALALALALGSAFMSRSYLNAKNPKFKHFDFYHSGLTAPDFSSPRLKFLVEDEDLKDITDKELEELKAEYGKAKVEKTASASTMTDLFGDQVKEMLIKVAAKLEKENLTNGGINQVIDCVALGEIDMLKSASSFDDMCDAACDYIANTKKIASEANRALAVSYIANDKVLGDVFVPYVCGEILEQNQAFDKLASVVTDENAAQEFASLLTMANLADKQEKFANIEMAKAANVKELSETLEFNEEFDTAMHNAIYGVLKSQVFA